MPCQNKKYSQEALPYQGRLNNRLLKGWPWQIIQIKLEEYMLA